MDCILWVGNFIWKIGFDHFMEYDDIEAQAFTDPPSNLKK